MITLSFLACATELSPFIDATHIHGQVVVGRVLAVITGETSRWYAPEVRLIEVENQQTGERFQVDMKSEDRYFAFVLPPLESTISLVCNSMKVPSCQWRNCGSPLLWLRVQ